MKSFFKLLILVTSLLLLPIIAFAREDELPQVVNLGDHYTISLPADWKASKVTDGAFKAESDTITVTIITQTYLDTLRLNITDKSNVVDALISLYALPPKNGTASRSDIQKVRYGDRLAAVYTDLGASEQDEMDVVLTMSSGAPGYLIFAANKGQLTVQRPTISAIISSFDLANSTGTNGSGNTGGNEGVSGAASGGSEATGGTAEVNCTVSAESANSAQLRVGPGTNRGAISFLPANVQVTVTGRIVLNDKSVWYQLDKAEAAPKGTAAAELWVAADQVTASGDCDHVGDASAPPVIPGNIAPPPVNNGGSSGDQGIANNAPGVVPTGGQWTMTFNATTNASCEGYENVPIPSTEVLDSITYTYLLRVTTNNTFVYGDDTYTRVPNTNTFTGIFTWRDGRQSQAWLTVNSATSINGQVIDNFTLDNTACSGTFLFLATRR